jgi:hypothetical protein
VEIEEDEGEGEGGAEAEVVEALVGISRCQTLRRTPAKSQHRQMHAHEYQHLLVWQRAWLGLRDA